MSDLAVAIARSWIGTPYVHQASARAAGSDCLGLIRGIWRELYGAEPEPVPPYSADWGEMGRTEILLRGATRHLVALSRDAQEAPGQVLLFRMREGAIAKHLGLLVQLGERSSFVHAYSGHGVIESPYSAAWRQRVVQRFRFP